MTQDNAINSATIHRIERLPNGQFKPGFGGRPKGVKNKQSRQAFETIKSYAPEALAKLHQAVIAGEKWAVEYVLSKVIPSNSRTVEFHGMEIEDIRNAFIEGDISIAELKDIVSAMEKIANVEELDELRERLEKLEAYANGQK